MTHLSKVVPWRPKDLQAIHDNFDLLDVGGNKELSYEEFLYFFASLRKLLPERHFKKFVEETVEQFDLQARVCMGGPEGGMGRRGGEGRRRAGTCDGAGQLCGRAVLPILGVQTHRIRSSMRQPLAGAHAHPLHPSPVPLPACLPCCCCRCPHRRTAW